MSIVPGAGGPATRAGIAYEDSVLIGYLVEVLAGEADSFTLEGGPNSTESGFEGVLRSLGTSEWVQCKRSAHDAGSWTVQRLTRSGVLENLTRAARSGNTARFVTDQRSVVGELADLARHFDDDIEWRTECLGRSESLATGVTDLEAASGLQGGVLHGILRSIEVRTIDMVMARERAIDRLRLVCASDLADRADAALRVAMSGELLGRVADRASLEAVLDRDCAGWRLPDRAELEGAVDACTDAFLDEVAARRQGCARVTRSIVGEILTAIDEMDSVVVSAPGGAGKSEVLAQVVERLRADGRRVLALSAVDLASDRANFVSPQLGFGDASPIAALAGQPGSVLVVDQVDTISPALGGDADRWRTFVRLVRSARSSGLMFILGARPLDLLSTPDIDASLSHDCRTTEVPLLTSGEQATLLAHVAPLPTDIATNPLMCVLWARSAPQAAGQAPTTNGVLAGFRREVQRTTGLSDAEIGAIESALLSQFDALRSTVCPEKYVSPLSQSVDRLVSAGYLARRHGRIGFAHERMLDHVWAAAFVGSGRSIDDVLVFGDLIAARQLRQHLDFVGDDPAAIHKALRSVLRDGTRSHLVAIALWWMRSWATPTPAAWRLLRDQLRGPRWRRGIVHRALRENSALFERAAESGWVDELVSGNDDDRRLVLWIATGVDSRCDERVAAIYLATAVTAEERRSALRLGADSIGEHTTVVLAEWISELGEIDDEIEYALTRAVSANHALGAKLLRAAIENRSAAALSETPEGLFSWRCSAHHERREMLISAMRWLAQNHPQTFRSELLPLVRECCSHLPDRPGEQPFLTMRSVVDGDDRGPHDWTGWMLETAITSHHRLGEVAPAEARSLLETTSVDNELEVALVAATLAGLPHAPADLAERVGAQLIRSSSLWTDWSALHVCSAIDALRVSVPVTTLSAWIDQLDDQSGAASMVVHALRGGPVDERPSPRSSYSGVVGPPVPAQEIASWTDDQWLDATQVHSADGTRISASGVLEGGRFELAHVLRESAQQAPARFGALAPRVAEAAHADYLWALVDGLARSELDGVDVEATIELTAKVSIRVDLSLARFCQRAASLGLAGPRAMDALRLMSAARLSGTDPFEGTDRDFAHDATWLNRADTCALDGLVSALALGDHARELDRIVTEVAVGQDTHRVVAVLWGLAAWVGHAPERARGHAEHLLGAHRDLASCQAARRLTRLLGARGWSVRSPLWDSLVNHAVDAVAHEAGRWWTVARADSEVDFVAALAQLPSAARAGAAAELATLVNARPVRLLIAAIRNLLGDEDPNVRFQAARWADRFIPRDGGESQQIPRELQGLVAPTVHGADRQGPEVELLIPLARLGGDAAHEALGLLSTLLAAGPADSLMDMVGYRAVGVIYAAHEALARDDRTDALDVLDRVIERDPVQTIERLAVQHATHQ